ncbi:hypothetical protein [Pseudonocardia xishanensis]
MTWAWSKEISADANASLVDGIGAGSSWPCRVRSAVTFRATRTRASRRRR